MWDKFMKRLDLVLIVILAISIGLDVYQLWFK
jgi:hypothetical protein